MMCSFLSQSCLEKIDIGKYDLHDFEVLDEDQTTLDNIKSD